MATPAPIGIDLNVIINTIIGGVITLTSSLAVAAVYIRNQNKNQKKKRMHEAIQRDYFDGCLNPTVGALSQYGTNTIFALKDSSIVIRRYLSTHDESMTNDCLKEIANRTTLQDFTTHNFKLLSEYLPTLQKFGRPIYRSVFLSVEFYSDISKDATSFAVLRADNDSFLPEVARSLNVLAMIIERSLLYLENRFLNLKDYFLISDIESYDDFVKIFLNEDYKKFLSAIENYNDSLRELMNAMKSVNSENRKAASMKFSDWLTNNMDNNPLAINKDLENINLDNRAVKDAVKDNALN